MSYSQNDEEGVLRQHFGDRKGHFLDVGAYDGRTFSNTLALAEAGWGGVLVEPSAGPFHSLCRIYREVFGDADVRFDFVHALVGVTADPLVTFWACDDAVSTTEEANRALWDGKASVPFVLTLAPQIALSDLLEACWGDTTFDLVSIDTEGTSVDLLRAFCACVPVAAWPEVFVVEHDGACEKIHRLLGPRGYQQAYFSGENLVMIRYGK